MTAEICQTVSARGLRAVKLSPCTIGAILGRVVVCCVCATGTAAQNGACEASPLPVSASESAPLDSISTVEAADEACQDTGSAFLAACHDHDVWLVSSRRASQCGDPEIGYELLEYWHAEDGCNWNPATAEEFHAADNPRVPTIFFVHGNRADFGEAQQMGWQWVRRFEQGEYGAGSARLVIYSWPSSAIPGKPIEDARIKARTSESYAWYLAALIDHLAPDVPVGLVGYSYGARLITASLHLMGGGRVAGRQLAPTLEKADRPVRAVLIAAAVDYHWLGVGQRHGLALSQVDRLVVFVNCADPVLKLYPRLYGHGGGPEALGRAGVASRARLGEQGAKLWQVDVTGVIGRHHDWQHHVNSGAVMGRARREFRFDEVRGSAQPTRDDPPPALPMTSHHAQAEATPSH